MWVCEQFATLDILCSLDLRNALSMECQRLVPRGRRSVVQLLASGSLCYTRDYGGQWRQIACQMSEERILHRVNVDYRLLHLCRWGRGRGRGWLSIGDTVTQWQVWVTQWQVSVLGMHNVLVTPEGRCFQVVWNYSPKYRVGLATHFCWHHLKLLWWVFFCPCMLVFWSCQSCGYWTRSKM